MTTSIETVDFTSSTGRGVTGALALPNTEGRAPAVVVIHEWWGLNDHVRSILSRLANEGFVAFAPDLYHGKTTRDATEAGLLMDQLDWKLAIEEIAGAARFLLSHPRANGRVGVMGFCMGGALSFAAATSVPEFSAIVPFYGIPSPEHADYSRVAAPIMAHFAARDTWAKAASATAIKERLSQQGKPMDLFVYDADHAFFNDTRPEVYSEAAAKLAFRRTIEFLRKHLS